MVTKIDIEVNRDVILDMIMPALGLTIDSVDEIAVVADPKKTQ